MHNGQTETIIMVAFLFGYDFNSWMNESLMTSGEEYQTGVNFSFLRVKYEF